MIQESTENPPRSALGQLHPCPFCGGGARLERDPWLGESVRIACGNDGCRVMPRTEYLLACYADELRAAWNARPAAPALAGGRGARWE
ncbi:MAG TPA: Lar family restriction alleviation protein [Longimicrobiaceae bacterium]|nr:Lar family restriction alleviation protein [Longimicrobiaceae bacterium]